jgi:hypothetical protein
MPVLDHQQHDGDMQMLDYPKTKRKEVSENLPVYFEAWYHDGTHQQHDGDMQVHGTSIKEGISNHYSNQQI